MFEIKVAADIVRAEDGKYYVDAATTKAGNIVRGWTEDPFDTEAKARDILQSQLAIPALEQQA